MIEFSNASMNSDNCTQSSKIKKGILKGQMKIIANSRECVFDSQTILIKTI